MDSETSRNKIKGVRRVVQYYPVDDLFDLICWLILAKEDMVLIF